MLLNDTYSTDRWKTFAKTMYGDEELKPHHRIPFIKVHVLPKHYDTAVHDLRESLDKRQRKALRYAKNQGHTARIVNAGIAMDLTIQHKKDLWFDPQKLYMAHADMGSAFYVCECDNKIVGGLGIMRGDKWITEFHAWGEQDAIKAQIIDDHKDDFDYYDLAGLRGDPRADAFKLKWAVKQEVRLR